MCEPFSIAAAAISIASAAAGYAAQSSAASQQKDYQQKMFDETRKAAITDRNFQSQQVFNRLEQDRAATSQQATENAAAAAQAKGTAYANFAERGMAGNTLQSLLGEFDRQQSANGYVLQTNYAWKSQQASEDLQSIGAGTASRIAGATPQPVAGPSALAAGLSIAGGVLSAYDTGMARTKSGPYADKANQTSSFSQRPLWRLKPGS